MNGSAHKVDRARVWREEVVIPTYGVGAPDRNPMFLTKRVYQGSSGAVYPLPVIDRVFDEKADRAWQAVFLENRFLKIMVLPELGGRVQMALDKTNDYHFVYYNRVIKPALVGLAGPWISGGIEFNWPQHHRPSTFLPVDCEIEEHEDGAATVWLHEIDRMHRTESTHGFTLRPDRAALEIDVRLYNRTNLPQTFLWWANPAVRVDEHHQSIFPPDVTAVMDHGKRDASAFPIATGEYYKVDYSPGTDISRWKNIPVPTSYMAYHSDYDFVGSYDHGKRAGLLHVANHHVAPGKKQWTWGTADFGRAWDGHLTDEDGPYIELMCGVYTDNQPDFSWLAPGEEKRFTQHFLPYQGVGVVKNATVDAAVGLDFENGAAVVRVYTTAPQPGAKASLHARGGVLWEASFDGGPGSFFERSVPLPEGISPVGLAVSVANAEGKPLVQWRVPADARAEIPEPAKPIETPDKLDGVESLYLAGLHLEQYRHATRDPAEYYREGLRRDPGDIRCNTALGKLLYRHGRFDLAESFLRRAIERLTRHNPNPYDGEASFYLGCALEAQGKFTDACNAYHKAVWNAAWQDAGYLALARLDCRAGRLEAALENVHRCLARNAAHRQARHLKVTLLRMVERFEQALHLANAWLRDDAFQFGLLYEARSLAAVGGTSGVGRLFNDRMRDDQRNYVELALEYAAAGLYPRASDVLLQYLERVNERPESAIVYYLLVHFFESSGQTGQAAEFRDRAVGCRPDHCFPNRLEEIAPLQAAAANPHDAKAPYYLGNLWYDRRQYDLAVACWEQSRDRDPSFPTVWRNLGLAYFNQRRDAVAAWNAFERAFQLDPTDARVLIEFDQLAKRLGHPPAQRLERLSQHAALVAERDDLSLEFVTLLNAVGRYGPALEHLLFRNFHPWEGGEGKVPAQYVLSLTQLARGAIAAGDFAAAVEHLARAQQWPSSLGEGKLPQHQENNIHYLRGVALAGLGHEQEARPCFRRAAVGLTDPTSAMYYNDQPPDMIYYQGLARQALGEDDAARRRFTSLVAYGERHLHDEPAIDYFAVSLPDFLVFDEDLTRRNELHCRYMMALGTLGLGRTAEAIEQFDHVLALDPSHLGAIVHRPDASQGKESVG